MPLIMLMTRMDRRQNECRKWLYLVPPVPSFVLNFLLLLPKNWEGALAVYCGETFEVSFRRTAAAQTSLPDYQFLHFSTWLNCTLLIFCASFVCSLFSSWAVVVVVFAVCPVFTALIQKKVQCSNVRTFTPNRVTNIRYKRKNNLNFCAQMYSKLWALYSKTYNFVDWRWKKNKQRKAGSGYTRQIKL